MLKHKTRNGILGIFIGLAIVVISLYIDHLRGDASGTIGVYQVAGALSGYIICGISVVLVMKYTNVEKTIKKFLYYGGGIIIVTSIFADHIGIAGPVGFDRFQLTGIGLGAIFFASGYFVPKVMSS